MYIAVDRCRDNIHKPKRLDRKSFYAHELPFVHFSKNDAYAQFSN